jgi:hypothetical protein
MKIPSRSLRAAALAAGSLFACAGSASAQVTWGTYEQPLEGRRYDMLRALANYLDETSQAMLQSATQDARSGTAAQRRLIPTVRTFVRQAQEFHRSVDSYQAQPDDVVDDVNFMIVRAKRLSDRLRASRGFASTQSDWRNVNDALDRMRRLLAGEDVQVPPAYGDLEDTERDYGPFRDVYQGTRGLTGASLQEFRRLAHDLDASAARAVQLAQQGGATPGGDRFMSDLQHFATQADNVHQRADANVVDPSEIAPIVSHLLEDARAADRNMRQAGALRNVWYEWSRAMSVLSRMNDLVTQR